MALATVGEAEVFREDTPTSREWKVYPTPTPTPNPNPDASPYPYPYPYPYPSPPSPDLSPNTNPNPNPNPNPFSNPRCASTRPVTRRTLALSQRST